MSDQESLKKPDPRKILALIALAGASIMAYRAGNYLSYVGITYYVVCAAAIILNYRRSAFLLWAAVVAHVVLVGYGLWNWQSDNVVPCIYCFGAAGFALLAATVYTRLAAALAPVFLIAITWYTWPYLFTDKGQAGVIQQQTQSQATEQQAVDQTVDVRSDPAGETGKTRPVDNTGAAVQTETRQEQTVVSTPAATNPGGDQGDVPDPNVTGEDKPGDKPEDKPEDKPGSGTTEQPPEPEPAKPGST